MKNIKLKYFAVALMMVLQWSCATTDIPEAGKGIDKTDSFGKESMLNEYETFRIDGVVTNDVKKIDAMMKSAHNITLDPEQKEVDFYSTEATYIRFNPEDGVNEKNDKSAKVAATTFPDDFADIGGFGADASGVAGLGNVLDQGYFRNFDNNICIFSRTSDIRQFYRLSNSTNLDNNVRHLQYYMTGILAGKLVVQTTTNMRKVLENASSGNATYILRNDTNGNKNLIFYSGLSYGGTSFTIKLAKNASTTLGGSFLSSLGYTAKSFKSVAY